MATMHTGIVQPRQYFLQQPRKSHLVSWRLIWGKRLCTVPAGSCRGQTGVKVKGCSALVIFFFVTKFYTKFSLVENKRKQWILRGTPVNWFAIWAEGPPGGVEKHCGTWPGLFLKCWGSSETSLTWKRNSTSEQQGDADPGYVQWWWMKETEMWLALRWWCWAKGCDWLWFSPGLPDVLHGGPSAPEEDSLHKQGTGIADMSSHVVLAPHYVVIRCCWCREEMQK